MQKNPDTAVSPRINRRPFSIFLLIMVILVVALTHFVRMRQAVVQWSYLSSLETVSPAYVLATGLFWGIFGLVAGLLLWLRWSQAGVLALAFLASYSLYFWIDRIFISASPERFVSWPFMLTTNLLVLGWAAWSVNHLRAKGYFKEPGVSSGSVNGGLDG